MKLFSFSNEAQLLIKSIDPVFQQLFPNAGEKEGDEIAIITPQTIKSGSDSIGGSSWALINQAWERINRSKNDNCLNEWRTIFAYGREVFPGLRLFKLKNTDSTGHFLLLDKSGLEAESYLIDLLYIIRFWQHLKKGRVYFHAAGIVKGGSAFLFQGPSGAGKSTVSAFSSDLGRSVIHDDHVVGFTNSDGRALLSDLALLQPVVSLKAIFFLIQDEEDKLTPLSPLETGRRLFDSLFETSGERILYGQYLREAFSVVNAIARSVPGYELHFTRSATFWKLIDDEKIS